MLILWIRKKQKANAENPGKENQVSFEKHNQEMKKFRQSHQGKISGDAVEFVTPDGGLLAPVVSIKLGNNTQN